MTASKEMPISQAADDIKLAPDADEPGAGDDAIDPNALDSHLDRKIVTKIDGVVLTLVTLVATMEFLDKNVSAYNTFKWDQADVQGMAYAAVWGMRADTGLVGQQYSWLGSYVFKPPKRVKGFWLNRQYLLLWIPGRHVTLPVPRERCSYRLFCRCNHHSLGHHHPVYGCLSQFRWSRDSAILPGCI